MNTKQLRKISIFHENLPDAIFNGLTAHEAAQILQHDEHLRLTARYDGRIVCDKSSPECEAPEIEAAILSRIQS